MKELTHLLRFVLVPLLCLVLLTGCSPKIADKLYFENTHWGDSPEEVTAALGYDLSQWTNKDNVWSRQEETRLPVSGFTVSAIALDFLWNQDGSFELSAVRLGFTDEKDCDAYRTFLCENYGQPEEVYGDADNQPDTLHEWWQYRIGTPEGDRQVTLRHYAPGHFLLNSGGYAGIFLITPSELRTI